MKFQLVSKDTQAQSIIVLAYQHDAGFTATGQSLDKKAQGTLSQQIIASQFDGKPGQSFIEKAGDHLVLILGAKNGALTTRDFRDLVRSMVSQLKSLPGLEACCTLAELAVENLSLEQKISLLINTSLQADYRFDNFRKTVADNREYHFTLPVDNANDEKLNAAVTRETIIAHAQYYCRDLGNTPANVCTPSYLLAEAKKLADKHPELSLEVIDDAKAEKLGMGAFASVSRGSKEPGYIVILNYQGGKKGDAPIAMVGKGITFDTGGNVIKPANVMHGMKFDMCGAASVIATMKATVELALPINLVCTMSCAENMVGHEATRPGDIVKTLSGQTVEIINTDAEGRLVLCDAMTYVQRKYKPKLLIDVATLTGAAIGTFAHEHTALMSNSEELTQALLKAAKTSDDPAWPLPLSDAYNVYLKSSCADMINADFTRKAGTIVAACYLHKFIENNLPWAHLDIAGSSLVDTKNDMASGRPVPLLLEFLMGQM
ncbi:MAG: leucyl aminopeptidase [Gammaproteobacteria bacterium CG11_big_fil_rev_8_21_14_0_20_46_22]|nr:MAG: leucyl aminopeptidase [Gammaproteobacteria bacterium CG12_big_fil_rev_8_21_14_0_65_46_12]PIR11230.1 MAG: leucyl aminopeptidase [Gammaproteobacteria bacterium CG11_big_fil_rev_8_21_14_0_20_46_22]